MPEERQRLLACPVQIVDQHDHRASRRGQREHRIHCGEEAVPLGVGVGARRTLESRDPAFDLGEEDRRLGDLLAVLFEQFVGHRPQQVVECRDERLIGHRQLRVARAVCDGGTMVTGPPGELDGESRLSRTRLPTDQYRSACAVAHRRPRLEQGLPLAAATDERCAALDGQCRGQRHGERPGRSGQFDRAPLDLERLDRLGETLQGQRAERPEPRSRTVERELTDESTGHDLPGRRNGLEPRGHHHRQAVAVAVLPADIADAQPDPDLQRREAAGDGLLHGDRRQHGIGRRVEGRHDPVARGLHDGAAVVGDDLVQVPFEVAEQLVGSRFTQFGSQRRRLHRIGEEDRRRGCWHGRPHFPLRATAQAH